MPQNGELPVLPMTALDEITYRTPDALFNGSALVSVIQSCIPNIKNAWEIPSCDLDTILIAIRIASYGHAMEMNTKCDKCENETDFNLDLRHLLDRLVVPDYNSKLLIGDLEIRFKPINYKEANNANLVNFENQKALRNADEGKIDDEQRAKLITELIKKITESTFKTVAANIDTIKTPNALVTDTQFILEFLQNCPRQMYEKIKNTVFALREASEIKPLDVKCDKCGHEQKQPFTLDMTNFFANAS